MKSTGIIRKLDNLGRVVLPAELLRVLDIQEGESMEFYFDEPNNQIMMRAYVGTACLFCRSAGSDMSYFKGKLVCQKCFSEINSINSMTVEERAELDAKTKQVIGQQITPKKINAENEPEGKRFKREDKLAKLLKAHQEDPNMNQRNLARVLGVTPPYVNILIKELRKRGMWNSNIRKVE